MVNLLKSISEDPRVKQLGPGLITGAAMWEWVFRT